MQCFYSVEMYVFICCITSFLLGDPPVRSTVLEQQEVKAHPLLQALAEEVHCVDLKTQVALQRSE